MAICYACGVPGHKAAACQVPPEQRPPPDEIKWWGCLLCYDSNHQVHICPSVPPGLIICNSCWEPGHGSRDCFDMPRCQACGRPGHAGPKVCPEKPEYFKNLPKPKFCGRCETSEHGDVECPQRPRWCTRCEVCKATGDCFGSAAPHERFMVTVFEPPMLSVEEPTISPAAMPLVLEVSTPEEACLRLDAMTAKLHDIIAEMKTLPSVAEDVDMRGEVDACLQDNEILEGPECSSW